MKRCFAVLLLALGVGSGCGYSVEPTPQASKWKELSPHLKKGDGDSWGGLWVFEDRERGYIIYSTDDGLVAVPILHPTAEAK